MADGPTDEAERGGRRIRPLSVLLILPLIAAVFLAGYQLRGFATGKFGRGKKVAEQLALARQQLDAGDFAAARASADSAVVLDDESDEARRVREDVAMAWLRPTMVRHSPPIAASEEEYVARVDSLARALDGGIVGASGKRRSLLLAYRGWADVLRTRWPGGVREPDRYFHAALTDDSSNALAHALWGRWLLLQRRDRAKALAHFAAAEDRSTPADLSLVRGVELTALGATHSLEDDVELLRLADRIRRDGGSMNPDFRHDIYTRYFSHALDAKERPTFLGALPGDAHVATYRWLFDRDLADSTRGYTYHLYLALVHDYAGNADSALAIYRRLPRAGLGYREQRIVDSGLARQGKGTR